MSVEGAVALAGGGFYLAPRVNDSFAIIDVGAPDVPIEFENRRVGKTGSNGKALVPDLRSFQKNKIAIDPSRLPVNASIGSTQETLIPADRGVVYAKFGVETGVSSAIVKFVSTDGKPLKSALSGKLNGDEDFIVGYDGRAFIKALKASNEVVIETEPGTCKAEFAYKTAGDEQVVIGPVQCK